MSEQHNIEMRSLRHQFEQELSKLIGERDALREQLVKTREALKLFADPACWRLGGSCDPNSGAFRGLEIAQAALTDDLGGSK